MKRKETAIQLTALAVLAAVLMVTPGCAGGIGSEQCLVGSPNVVTREFDFDDFTRLHVGSAFEVQVDKADSYGVSITANENLFDYLELYQEGETLTIELKRWHSYTNTTRKASITLPDLRGLSLSGASRGKVEGFSSSQPLDLELSGASSLDIDDLEAGDTTLDVSGASRAKGSITMAKARFDVSGASTIELEGSASGASIDVSGASSAGLADFSVVVATVDLSGASRATIDASGTLDCDLSGASRLNYVGNPALGHVEVSGASTISQISRGG